jgi:hypothetical protein
MARTIPSGLQPLLDLESCDTETTLDLYLADTSQIHVATDAFTADSRAYTADLRKSNELKQTVGSPPDRSNLIIQNVDKVFGGYVDGEDLIHATAVIGRYYTDPNGGVAAKWVELFRGEAFPLNLNEMDLQIEVLSDLAAAGYCVGSWTLAEQCQFVFKNAGTCGYSGSETICNKKRQSKAGCQGRDNQHRFGGMEFPDIQAASAPAGGGGDSGGEHNNCPRVDQWIPVSGPHGQPEVKQAEFIRRGDWVINPLSRFASRVRSVRLEPNVPIWEIVSDAGVAGYSSVSHPVFPYREHINGLRVADMFPNDPLLLWKPTFTLVDNRVARMTNTGTRADVVRIELEDGHVYAYGDSQEIFIVCHNSKPLDGGGDFPL